MYLLCFLLVARMREFEGRGFEMYVLSFVLVARMTVGKPGVPGDFTAGRLLVCWVTFRLVGCWFADDFPAGRLLVWA